jgi:hypothetical protein
MRYTWCMTGMETSVGRVRRRRDRLRAAGLRAVQIWVPDIRAAGFVAECARQAQVIRDAETAESLAEDEAWLDITDKAGWTA